MHFYRLENMLTLDDDAADAFRSLNVWLEETVRSIPPLDLDPPSPFNFRLLILFIPLYFSFLFLFLSFFVVLFIL